MPTAKGSKGYGATLTLNSGTGSAVINIENLKFDGSAFEFEKYVTHSSAAATYEKVPTVFEAGTLEAELISTKTEYSQLQTLYDGSELDIVVTASLEGTTMTITTKGFLVDFNPGEFSPKSVQRLMAKFELTVKPVATGLT
jgi:hypothetical protein